jgi:hypothetical protein
VSRHIHIRVSQTVYDSIAAEADQDHATVTQFVLEAVLFRVAYQQAERGNEMREALREAYTQIIREDLHGRNAADHLRNAVLKFTPDLLGEAIRRLETWDALAARTARAHYGIPEGQYHPEETA